MQKKSGPAAKELKTEDDLLLAQEANDGKEFFFYRLYLEIANNPLISCDCWIFR